MNLHDYFDPVELEKPTDSKHENENLFCRNIKIHTVNSPIDDLSKYMVAILGIPEDRKAKTKGSSEAPNLIREQLYQLFKGTNKVKIIDLGNIKTGQNYNDTTAAIKDIYTELLAHHLITIVIGGSQDLTLPVFYAYEKFENLINFTSIDSEIDLAIELGEINSVNYLAHVMLHRNLFRYTHIGHQQYYTDTRIVDLLQKHYHQAIRLGNIKHNVFKAEPSLRDSHIVSCDIGVVKQADAPGKKYGSPNGLFSDEICQISKYAGLSENCSCFGIFETNPACDINKITSILVAQMIWYFIEGVNQRINEYPKENDNNFKTFIVGHEEMDHSIKFYKSLKTERWWMEIPSVKTGKNLVIACSLDEYNQACKHEIPDLWWKCFQKLN